MVEPRMFMVSSEIGSWPLTVILTVRRAVFICGETEEIVPWTMVPLSRVHVSSHRQWAVAEARRFATDHF